MSFEFDDQMSVRIDSRKKNLLEAMMQAEQIELSRFEKK